MTKGEKIETILNVDRDCIEVHGENGTMTFTVTQDWWNAEYKEPTTKNDKVDCERTDCNNCVNHKYCDYKPTTKNNLGVENDLVSSIVEKISEKVTETHEEFIFETIKPYCENVVQMKISKRDLEQALLEYYGKNDLGVDCISREQALRELKESAEHHANDSREEVLLRRDRDIISALPSVTPIRPKGHWINKFHLFESCSAECSSCHKRSNGYMHDNGFSLECKYYDYCPKCGSDNREVEG